MQATYRGDLTQNDRKGKRHILSSGAYKKNVITDVFSASRGPRAATDGSAPPFRIISPHPASKTLLNEATRSEKEVIVVF